MEMLVVLIAEDDSVVFGDWQELSSGCYYYTLKRHEKCCPGGGQRDVKQRRTQVQKRSSESDRFRHCN